MQGFITKLTVTVASAQAAKLLSNFQTPDNGDLILTVSPTVVDSEQPAMVAPGVSTPEKISIEEFIPAVSDSKVIDVELTDDTSADEATIEANAVDCCCGPRIYNNGGNGGNNMAGPGFGGSTNFNGVGTGSSLGFGNQVIDFCQPAPRCC